MKKGTRLSDIAKWSISNHQLAIKITANFALLILQFAFIFWWQLDIQISDGIGP